MNKKIFALFATISISCTGLFAPPKKVKKEKNDDLNLFLIQYNQQNKKMSKDNKKLDKNEKKLDELKKQMKDQNAWNLKDYFKKEPLSFEKYCKELDRLKDSFDYQYECINIIEQYYQYCSKAYKQKIEIQEIWGDNLSFDEFEKAILNVVNILDVNNAEHLNLHLFFAHCAKKMMDNDQHFHEAKITLNFFANGEFSSEAKLLAKNLFKILIYARYHDLAIVFNEKKDSYMSILTEKEGEIFNIISKKYAKNNVILDERITLFSTFTEKIITDLFGSMIDIISLLEQDADNAKKNIDTTCETHDALQKLIKQARESKKVLSKDLLTEIKRCKTLKEQLEKLTSKKDTIKVSQDVILSKTNNIESAKNEVMDEIILHQKKEENNIENSEEFISDKNVLLQDEQSNIKEKKNKSIIQTEHPMYTEMHPRVSEWFINPERRIEEDYSECGNEIKKLMVKFHALTTKVDFFMVPLALKCSWLKNGKDIGSSSYNIAAEIFDLETKKRYIGVISWGITKDGVLFHRCFSERIPSDIITLAEERIDTSLYPSIQEVKSLEKPKYINFQSDKESTVKQNEMIIEIHDKPNKMIIKLCKPLQNVV